MAQSLADSFTFTSPLDDHLKLDVFKTRCWQPNAGKIKSVDVQEVIINGDAIFVIGNATNPDGKFFRNCDYFKLKSGKIISYECFFGPGINYPTNTGKIKEKNGLSFKAYLDVKLAFNNSNPDPELKRIMDKKAPRKPTCALINFSPQYDLDSTGLLGFFRPTSCRYKALMNVIMNFLLAQARTNSTPYLCMFQC